VEKSIRLQGVGSKGAGNALSALWSRARQNAGPLLVILFTLWLIVVPLILLIVFSFRSGTPWQPEGFTLQNYVNAYSTGDTYVMFFNTAVLALVSTIFSVAIAVLFAFLTERTDMPFRNVAWGLMLIPMAVPGLLFAISWTFLFSPRNGLINLWLRELFSVVGFNIAEGPFNIYSLWGMIFLDSLRGVTTIFLMIVGAFRAMDPTLEEAARVSGASNRVTFFRVFLPLLTPAILAAFMYSFMSSLESLEIAMVIGFPAGIYVFSTYIYFSTLRFSPPQYGLSAALGVIFLIVSLFFVYLYRRAAGQAGKFATITGKGYRPRLIHLGKWRYPAFFLFLGYFGLTILAPTLILLWRSLTAFYISPSWKALSFLSLDNYRFVFEEDKIFSATWNTIVIGMGTGTLTMLLALVVAWVVVRKQFRGKTLLDGVTFLPHALPGVIIGIAFIFLYLQPPLNQLQLYGTVWLIILGLTVGYIAFGSRTMTGAVTQIHRELEEAGQVSGAKWRVVMFRIVLPLLLPAFISGWIWVASHALRSFSVPLILGAGDSRVLAVIMWDFWDEGLAGETTALGVLLIVALTILTVGGRWTVSRMSRWSHQA